ncbi:MAG: site-specific DNA-methyltransferase [Pseudoxanthomonas spadix]|nr:MAG: site-specific DNA-methyltransferase [Pseudoxanthomonas spadix]
MDKLKMHSPDLTAANIARIRDLFPGCVTEARGEDGGVKLAVDFDLLRQELSGALVEGPQERYHLDWPGKREALLTANAPIAKVDAEGNRLVANTAANGRFHSDWLTMIYSRLRLSRNLLRDDGFIFISIGNDEESNLRKVCDEIFGEKNFIECISWNKRIPKNDKGVGNIHDFILVYAKDATIPHELVMRKDGLEDIYELTEKLKKSRTSIPDAEAEIRKLYKKQGYDRGITLYNSFDENYRLWGKINMSWPNADTFGPRYEVLHPATGEPVAIPARGWRWKQETFNEAAKIKGNKYTDIKELNDGSYMCGRIWFSADADTQPSSIIYLDDVNTFLLRSILSLKSDGGIELEEIFEGKSYFSYPKPTSLLKILISSLSMEDGDIVMDFFAGSSTTAHALMLVNSEDKINRRFVMAQLDEPTTDESEAFKAGYKTIADISKERIRRAGNRISNDLVNSGVDTGFRVLKIDTSNMADVFYSPDATTQNDLLSSIDNIKSHRTPEDLLFQVMLDWGVDLALPIEKKTIAGKDVFFVDTDALAACFDADGGIDDAFIKELAKTKPLRAVFRDKGFKDDAAKINADQIFKQLSPGTDVKTL